MIPESARLSWIMRWFKRNSRPGLPAAADVLNRWFVDSYSEATEAPCQWMVLGADKCPQLGRDLAKLHKRGLLSRHPTGTGGLCGMGFPRWVYVYRLKT